MINAPSLVQGGEHIASDHLITNEAQISEQLMIMRLAVRQSLLLVVTMAQEGLFTLGANEVLDMPMFAEGRDHTLLDGPMASTTNGNAHLVVTSQTVKLALQFARIRV